MKSSPCLLLFALLASPVPAFSVPAFSGPVPLGPAIRIAGVPQDSLPDDPDARANERLAEMLELVDTASDDWSTEVVADEAKAWLHETLEPFLGVQAEEAREAAALVLRERTAEDVVVGPIGTVRSAGAGPASLRHGRAELEAALSGFAADLELERVAWKVIGVEVLASERSVSSGGPWRTTVRVSVLARAAGKRVQRNAIWEADWTRSAAGELVLAGLTGTSFEDATGSAHAAPLVDRTPSVLGAAPVWTEHLRPSLPSWQLRIESNLGISFLGHQGLALGDVDGDGVEELFVCQPGGLPNVLLRRQSDGSAVDIAQAAGLDHLDASRSALFVDFDRDGDQDLACVLGDDVVFFANDGAGRFDERTSVAAPVTTSLAAADYDRDGDVDLYVCGYVNPYIDAASPIPYHDAENGQANQLLRNDVTPESWSFPNVTVAVGLDQNNRRFSFAASFEDYDRDGDPDLYVANDFGRNNLYENTAEGFRDVAAEAGVEDLAAGMGVSWGDFDNDGDSDLYVSNMYSAAGRRVAYQRRFRPSADDAERAAYLRHARGNTLFENRGDGTFADVTDERNAEFGRWAWGAQLFDMDLDGWLDIVCPNGFVTGERYDDL